MTSNQPISRQRAWQLRNQSKGRCVTCGDVAQYRQTRCKPCAAKNHVYQKELREMMRSVSAPVRFDKRCQYCGSEFETRRAVQMYCSTDCQDQAWNEKKRAKRGAMMKFKQNYN